MQIIVGIDDTDTKDTRGTGFNARQIGKLVDESKVGLVEGITRHQLFFDPRIPYTSQNSSACLIIETEKPEELKQLCLDYLNEIAPVGSDVGFCITAPVNVNQDIKEWGNRAKVEVLTQPEAYQLAKDANIHLEGLCGTKDGIIGALAAVGLRIGGNDGRFIWLKGKQELREIPQGIYKIHQLRNELKLNQIKSREGLAVKEDDCIFVGEWIRPILRDGQITLIVERIQNNKDYEWRIAAKEYLKTIS